MNALSKSLAIASVLSATNAFASADELTHARQLAEKNLTTAQKQTCLEDFSRKVKSSAPVKMNGNFSFNDSITKQVYTTLYWKNSDHGVVFTVPVRSSVPAKGEVVANLACFYSVADDGIEFQGSQQVVWRAF